MKRRGPICIVCRRPGGKVRNLDGVNASICDECAESETCVRVARERAEKETEQ